MKENSWCAFSFWKVKENTNINLVTCATCSKSFTQSCSRLACYNVSVLQIERWGTNTNRFPGLQYGRKFVNCVVTLRSLYAEITPQVFFVFVFVRNGQLLLRKNKTSGCCKFSLRVIHWLTHTIYFVSIINKCSNHFQVLNGVAWALLVDIYWIPDRSMCPLLQLLLALTFLLPAHIGKG